MRVYDAAGNRLEKWSNGQITTYQCDAANQLEKSWDSVGTTTYQYDQGGNLQVMVAPPNARTTNVWDDENRRVKVQLPGGLVNTSVYNGDGLRVEVQDLAGARKMIWDGKAYLMETDGSGVTKVVYTQEPTEFGSLISQRRDIPPPVE